MLLRDSSKTELSSICPRQFTTDQSDGHQQTVSQSDIGTARLQAVVKCSNALLQMIVQLRILGICRAAIRDGNHSRAPRTVTEYQPLKLLREERVPLFNVRAGKFQATSEINEVVGGPPQILDFPVAHSNNITGSQPLRKRRLAHVTHRTEWRFHEQFADIRIRVCESDSNGYSWQRPSQ